MKFANRIDSDKSFAASFNGDPMKLESIEGYSICASWSGGVGVLKLQASNNAQIDNVGDLTVAQMADPNAVWVDITGSSVAVNGAGDQFWNVADVYYKWFRVVYTRTSGTGTFTAYLNVKGIV
jgi:hypothetical protein